jgi:hypothetical protein
MNDYKISGARGLIQSFLEKNKMYLRNDITESSKT